MKNPSVELFRKEQERKKILDAALFIGASEGWGALTIRKIATSTDQSVPLIYESFLNKDAILAELARLGYLKLTRLLSLAMDATIHPDQQIKKMWIAYWQFAFEESAYYHLMFGMGTFCPLSGITISEAEMPAKLFKSAIKKLYQKTSPNESELNSKYFMFWSLVHGLISLNSVNKHISAAMNKTILIESLSEIIKTIRI
jgi:AcrR family transcriptional regulator